MIEQVSKRIAQSSLLVPGQSVTVGLSGGADSVVLTHILVRLGYRVKAVHVHHGIRDSEADRDAAFAEDFCKKLAVPCEVVYVDVPAIAEKTGQSMETCAREERYRILMRNASAEAPVAVAHHADDQAETVLMHLARGSGLKGLTGMQYCNGFLIRPLLDISRAQIEAYASDNELTYVTDSTNAEDACTRNFLRHNVIPQWETVQPQLKTHIVQCASRLAAYRAYFDEKAAALFKTCAVISDNGLLLKDLPQSALERCELFRYTLCTLRQKEADTESIHIALMEELWQNASGRELILPDGITARKEYDTLVFRQKTEATASPCLPLRPGEYSWFEKKLTVALVAEPLYGSFTETLNADALPPETVIRRRQEGDRFRALGAPGHCTLKKYLINKKVPVSLRDRLPVIAAGSEVLAVIGCGIAEEVKITPQTKNMICVKEEEK